MFHDTMINMFQLDLPILEKILRPIFVYFFLIIGLRIAGKRELAQLNPFDLIVLLTLSNTVQNAIIGNDNSVTGGIIGASALLLLNHLAVRYIHRHKSLQQLVEGKRDCLIHNGKLLKNHLNREMMSRQELTAACHRQGLASLAEVETAILEPTGTITFVAKTPTTDEMRHHEILDAIDHLKAELDVLRGAKAAPPAA
jgi:uncharacterized membrane protein YcaP (DUF421 family)